MRELANLLFSACILLGTAAVSLAGPGGTGNTNSTPSPGGQAYGFHDAPSNPPTKRLGLRERLRGRTNGLRARQNKNSTVDSTSRQAFGKNRPLLKKLMGQ
jgi:hypothetical protein